MYMAVDDIKTNPVIIVVWENKYIMLSKRTLYSFISFRFVKLALPREHKSQKENVFEKKRRNKFGNFFLSQVSPDGRPIFSRTVCYIGDLFGATPVLNLWRFHIFAVLFIKIELEFQSQKFPEFETLTEKVHRSYCFFYKTIKAFALCLWCWSNITCAHETQTKQCKTPPSSYERNNISWTL